MPCTHKWKTVGKVTQEDHDLGNPKFSKGFETYNALENPISGEKLVVIAVRRRQCTLCQERSTTVEMDHFELKVHLPNHNHSLFGRTKVILIDVAKGTTHLQLTYGNRISYMELYEALGAPFGAWSPSIRIKATRFIEEIVIEISDANIANGEPPLNAIVVRKDTGLPGPGWNDWAKRNVYKKTPQQAQNEVFNHPWP